MPRKEETEVVLAGGKRTGRADAHCDCACRCNEAPSQCLCCGAAATGCNRPPRACEGWRRRPRLHAFCCRSAAPTYRKPRKTGLNRREKIMRGLKESLLSVALLCALVSTGHTQA